MREQERERGGGGGEILLHLNLKSPAGASAVPMCSLRIFTCTGNNADAQVLQRGEPAQTHRLQCSLIRQRGRKRFSDPARKDKAALQFRNMQPAC